VDTELKYHSVMHINFSAKNLIVSETSFFNYRILIYFKTNTFHIKIHSPLQNILAANYHLQRATPVFKAK